MLYYGTALHELTHWTGAESRLNRDLKNYSVSETARAREELIAEIGSYALCKDLKLDFNPQNSAAYVQSWCEILRDKPDEIMKATHAALTAKEYIQGSEHRMEKVQSIRNNVQGENNMGRGIQTDGRKSVREVGKEIWSLTNFSEGNIYGSDFETWYRECFPYTIHTAVKKISDGHCSYKGGSFVAMEAKEAKDNKPHTFFFDKEHFVEYYGEQKAKRLFDTDLRNEQKSFQLTQFLTAEILQTDRSISTEPEAIKKATIERIDKRMEYIDADMQDFKKDAKYEVPEEYYESVVHDFQMDIDYFDDLKNIVKICRWKNLLRTLPLSRLYPRNNVLKNWIKKIVRNRSCNSNPNSIFQARLVIILQPVKYMQHLNLKITYKRSVQMINATYRKMKS
jgi:DNA primase traC